MKRVVGAGVLGGLLLSAAPITPIFLAAMIVGGAAWICRAWSARRPYALTAADRAVGRPWVEPARAREPVGTPATWSSSGAA